MNPSAPDPGQDLSKLLRDDRGRLLAALIHTLGDFDLAEDALSDAIESALVHWRRSGSPNRPDAWLLQVARRKAIDRIRRGQRLAARTPDIQRLIEEDEEAQNAMAPDIPDDRLRLIFTCCHPALDQKTRVALTLRTVGGLTTREIARAFLDTETAMGQRLSRAKAKIGAAGIPYKVPDRPDWDARLGSVLTVIYLIFNEGWTAGPGEAPIRDTLTDEAIFLARLMCDLAPDEPEIEGLLALLLFTRARRAARAPRNAGLVDLDAQDRRLWDQTLVADAHKLLDTAVARARPGPYQCQAAIQALHMTGDGPKDTDWPQIVLLYDRLLTFSPSPVIRLNRAVALAEAGRAEAALAEIKALATELDAYQPFHAARAELFARTGQTQSARTAYARAIALSNSDDERRWLSARAAHLSS